MVNDIDIRAIKAITGIIILFITIYLICLPTLFKFFKQLVLCEKCQGEGQLTISMQFMADVHLKCDECNGKRFKDEVLEVKYKGKNISEVLEMTVEESLTFFEEDSTLCKKIKLISKLN